MTGDHGQQLDPGPREANCAHLNRSSTLTDQPAGDSPKRMSNTLRSLSLTDSGTNYTLHPSAVPHYRGVTPSSSSVKTTFYIPFSCGVSSPLVFAPHPRQNYVSKRGEGAVDRQRVQGRDRLIITGPYRFGHVQTPELQSWGRLDQDDLLRRRKRSIPKGMQVHQIRGPVNPSYSPKRSRLPANFQTRPPSYAIHPTQVETRKAPKEVPPFSPVFPDPLRSTR